MPQNVPQYEEKSMRRIIAEEKKNPLSRAWSRHNFISIVDLTFFLESRALIRSFPAGGRWLSFRSILPLTVIHITLMCVDADDLYGLNRSL